MIHMVKSKIAAAILMPLVLALYLTSTIHADDPDFIPNLMADGWSYEQPPFAVVPYPVAAIAFDSSNNLYTTNWLEEYSGDTITVYQYKSPEYDFECPSIYVSYPKIFDTTSGMDFDDKGNLFVSEIIQRDNPTGYRYVDAGLIRMVHKISRKLSDPIEFIDIPGIPGDLGDFRATGIAATGNQSIYFPGRKWSDPDWGNIYLIDFFKKYIPGTEPPIVRPNLVMYAIADDTWGQIFVADDAIYARNPYTQSVVTIAEFSSPKYVEELAFDSDGYLYALEGDDGPGPYQAEILRIIPPQIIISGCNTGIIDWPMEDGSTIGGLIEESCVEDPECPGEFVRCVLSHSVDYMKTGLLSPRQMAAIAVCAANATK
jgi:hypothetical protein